MLFRRGWGGETSEENKAVLVEHLEGGWSPVRKLERHAGSRSFGRVCGCEVEEHKGGTSRYKFKTTLCNSWDRQFVRLVLTLWKRSE